MLTATTPTLTPTTLANIEQTFIELQSVPTVRTASQDLQTQSGFVPPIVDPMPSSRSQDYDYDNYDLSHDDSESMDSDWTPSDPKKSRGSPNKSYGTSLTTEKATPSKKGGRRGMNTSQVRTQNHFHLSYLGLLKLGLSHRTLTLGNPKSAPT